MRYFVTGGAGFIGSHYVRRLLGVGGSLASAGFEPSSVTVYDLLTYAGNRENLTAVGDRIDFVHGDICDVSLLAEVLPGHDFVINFAAESHVDRSILGPSEFVRTNVLGTQTLLDVARASGVARVVHIGTDEVYGSIDEGSWTEESPLRPNSPYAASKAAADLIVRACFVTHGMDVVSTRCSNNYGPFQFPEKVIPLFVTRLLDGERVPLYGDGGNRREWLHVDDHVEGIQIALERGLAGQTYNIGGGCELSNLELTTRILAALGATPDSIEPAPDRLGHDWRYSLDDSLIRTLGYRPHHDFNDGLAATIEWYSVNEAWWRPVVWRD